jgi:hypothetical protein
MNMSNGAVAAVIIIRIKRIMATMRARGATTPDRALPANAIPYSGTWIFRRLVKYEVIRMHGDSYYMDEAAAQEYLSTRRKRVIFIILFLLLFFIIAMILSNS